ncbi:serine hydrolase domain-containing protein [Colwellia sp. MEBiC06753]
MRKKITPIVVTLLASMSLTTQAVDLKKHLEGYSLSENQSYANAVGYNKELLGGGDTTLWWSQNISRTMLTAVLPNRLTANEFKDDSVNWAEKLSQVSANTILGEMTLSEVLKDPRAAAKAIIVLREGKIVFEAYPGMKPTDNHLWASVAKPTASLLIEQLIDEGKIKENDKVEKYLTDFAGTALGNTTVLQLLDMVPGTDTHDSPKTRVDPNSTATRYYLAEFNEAYQGKQETVREILKQAKRTGPAGEKFEYSSGITQMLVFLAEAVTNKTWPDAFDERVWSHVRADSALQVHLAPDGMAMAHGIVSSRLRDLARYGLLYTQYWPLVADKQVVSDEALARIANLQHPESYLNGDGKRFRKGLVELSQGQSRQWDAVYADGGIFKGGMFGQGLYVEPENGVVIAFYSTVPKSPLYQFVRPLAKALK